MAARIRIADNLLIFSEQSDESSGEHKRHDAGWVPWAATTTASVQSRPVALLVCDIRGFSTMSETIPSADMAQMLGAWFRETGNLVAQSGGTIDKFIGDAMLAYWGAAGKGAADCGSAFAAAKDDANAGRGAEMANGAPFRIAVALHFGKVTCSNVGVACRARCDDHRRRGEYRLPPGRRFQGTQPALR